MLHYLHFRTPNKPSRVVCVEHYGHDAICKFIPFNLVDGSRQSAGSFICHTTVKCIPNRFIETRYATKNVVAAGLADKCEIQVSYAIGEPEPLSINIDCFGTEKISINKLYDVILQVFDFRPGIIIKDLDLKRPIYKKTAAYGHFGRDDHNFTWEKVNRVEKLKKALQKL